MYFYRCAIHQSRTPSSTECTSTTDSVSQEETLIPETEVRRRQCCAVQMLFYRYPTGVIYLLRYVSARKSSAPVRKSNAPIWKSNRKCALIKSAFGHSYPTGNCNAYHRFILPRRQLRHPFCIFSQLYRCCYHRCDAPDCP